MNTTNHIFKGHNKGINLLSMLTFFLLLLLMVSPANIYADEATTQTQQQAKVVKGVVTDITGESIIGLSILEKGTTNGTISDIDGKYSISLQGNNPVLVFSYIGYIPQQISVGSQSEINLTMKEDTRTLDEVVVVSYGTQKKRDMTGSIASVKADALSDLPVGQIGQKLQGQVAGVQINQSTGIPGQGMSFRIRGAVSINNNSQPLIVVDGFPLSAGLNNINPDEVESFTVLKDAAATALYGSRAGNGVIMITTKRGKEGKLNTQFQAYVGVQTLTGMKEMDIMNGREFAQFKKEWYEDAVRYGEIIPTADNPTGVPQYYQNPEQYGRGTNWYKILTQNALTQSYSLSLNGGSERATTATTLGYYKQEGVVQKSGFERVTLRSNNDFQVNDKIRIGVSVSPMLQMFRNGWSPDGQRQLLSGAMIADPTQSPYDENGDLKISLSSPGMFPQLNWLRAVKEKKNDYRILSLLANTFVDVDIWNGIKYNFKAAADMEWRKQRTWNPSTSNGDWATPPPRPGSANYNNSNYYTWTLENMLTYSNTFGAHSVGALVGYSAQKFKSESANVSGSNFPNDDISWITGAVPTRDGSTSMADWTVASVLGRIDYNFKERYLVQFNIRRDGSSRFGAEKKWASFPSVSAGWIVSEESFMEPLKKKMNYLKIRASYGKTGNYNIGNYQHLAIVGNANYVLGGSFAPGKAPSNLGNPYLTWEENAQFDIGLDFGFFNDRLFVMYDFYRKKTTALLNSVEIPWSSGFENVMSNTGEIKSWGHEVSFESRNLVGNFEWKTNLNLTFSRNEVLKLGLANNPIGGHAQFESYNRLEVGKPVGIFMGWIYDGVYMNQKEFDSQPKHATSEVGTVRFKDINGDGVINMDDRTQIGDPNPDMIFGLTNDFRWKNFDLSVLFTGQIGGDIFAGTFENTLNLDGVFNVLREVKDRWRSEENPGAGKIPRTKGGTTELYRSNHSDWVYDGTHITLKNVTLGYTIPFKPNNYISKARVYFSAQQLFTICDYPGLNPQVSMNNELGWNGMGVDRTSYPIPRIFSIGCNITF